MSRTQPPKTGTPAGSRGTPPRTRQPTNTFVSCVPTAYGYRCRWYVARTARDFLRSRRGQLRCSLGPTYGVGFTSRRLTGCGGLRSRAADLVHDGAEVPSMLQGSGRIPMHLLTAVRTTQLIGSLNQVGSEWRSRLSCPENVAFPHSASENNLQKKDLFSVRKLLWYAESCQRGWANQTSRWELEAR